MSTWVLTTYGSLPEALPTGLADEWEQTLIAERLRIKSGLDVKIPNETAYKDKLADASSDRYAEFLATVGGAWDKDTITTKQRVKLNRKYLDWKAGIDLAFAEGGTFEQNVTGKKGKLEALRYALGLVGNRSQDRWRCGSLLALALGGDTRIARYITSPDTLAGTIEVALASPYNWADRPMIVAGVMKYGVIAKYAHEGGLTVIRDAQITALNALLDIVEGHNVADSTLVLTASWDGTYNHVKIIADYTAPA